MPYPCHLYILFKFIFLKILFILFVEYNTQEKSEITKKKEQNTDTLLKALKSM